MLKQTKNILKKKKFIRNKHGVSEIISYMILVAITLGVSVGVYTFLKYQIPSCGENDIDCFSEIDCPDGTSIMINGYTCDSFGVNITLDNNGRFNITGIIMAVTNDSSKIPSMYLTPSGSNGGKFGEFIFQSPLKPSDGTNIRFSKISKSGLQLNKIEKIKMQIFITNTGRRLCKSPIITEDFKNCLMN